jgi:hypothetical protein
MAQTINKDRPLTPAEVQALRTKLASMSITGIRDFYFAAHWRCRLEQGTVPSARAVQELVQAWKELRKSG